MVFSFFRVHLNSFLQEREHLNPGNLVYLPYVIMPMNSASVFLVEFIMSGNKKKKRHLKTSIRRFSRQTLIVVLSVVLIVGLTGYIALLLLLKGPSPTFSNMVVSTMWETRRGKAIVNALFTDEEIEAILAKNSTVGSDFSAHVNETDNTEWNIPESEKDDIQVIDVNGSSWKGKLMIVRDPSRIELGVNTEMGDAAAGHNVEEYVSYYGAVAGINAGGFEDPNGQGDGSANYGIVIKDGQVISHNPDYVTVIGFNEQDHLIVGDMTSEQAIEWGITDAVTFGPVLVYDSHALPIQGSGGGLNPRTVIGQKPDGSVLLLVIDGRQTNSIGASYEDCANLMLEYGAMTAANLDGGSSTVMVYNGEIINSVVSMDGDRQVPTAWLVK